VSPRVDLLPELRAAFAFALAGGGKRSEESGDSLWEDLWGCLINTTFSAWRETGAGITGRTPQLGGLRHLLA